MEAEQLSAYIGGGGEDEGVGLEGSGVKCQVPGLRCRCQVSGVEVSGVR